MSAIIEGTTKSNIKPMRKNGIQGPPPPPPRPQYQDLEEVQIGVETYPKCKGRGGQHVGLPIRGVRLFYPKDGVPDIDIRIRVERSQLRNKNLAEILLELPLEEI